MNDVKELTTKINECLDSLKKNQRRERIIIDTTLTDLKNIGPKDNRYYSTEFLPKKELEAIKSNKNYQVISLVTGYDAEDPRVNMNPGKSVKCADTGIEVITRTKNKDTNEYITNWKLLVRPEEIRGIANYLAGKKITTTGFQNLFDEEKSQQDPISNNIIIPRTDYSIDSLSCQKYVGAEKYLNLIREQCLYEQLSPIDKILHKLNLIQDIEDNKQVYQAMARELLCRK
jgi:hypothetical protein